MNKKSLCSHTVEKSDKPKYTAETFITTFLCAYFTVSIFNLLSHLGDEVYYTSLEFLQADGSGALVGVLFAIVIYNLYIMLVYFAIC